MLRKHHRKIPARYPRRSLEIQCTEKDPRCWCFYIGSTGCCILDKNIIYQTVITNIIYQEMDLAWFCCVKNISYKYNLCICIYINYTIYNYTKYIKFIVIKYSQFLIKIVNFSFKKYHLTCKNYLVLFNI